MDLSCANFCAYIIPPDANNNSEGFFYAAKALKTDFCVYIRRGRVLLHRIAVARLLTLDDGRVRRRMPHIALPHRQKNDEKKHI